MTDCYDEVKGTWKERFEATYGRWRGFVDDVVFAFTDCAPLIDMPVDFVILYELLQ